MPTTKSIAHNIVKSFGGAAAFRIKPMFGEYALCADDKVVGLICNDQLYLKIVPASQELAGKCKKGSPYEGSKEQYVVEASQYTLAAKVAVKIAESVPTTRKK